MSDSARKDFLRIHTRPQGRGNEYEIGANQWELMTPLYYHGGEDWSFGAGLRYQSTDVEVSDSTFLNEDRLHSLELALF